MHYPADKELFRSVRLRQLLSQDEPVIQAFDELKLVERAYYQRRVGPLPRLEGTACLPVVSVTKAARSGIDSAATSGDNRSMLTRQEAPDWIIRDATIADTQAILDIWARSEARPSLTDNASVVQSLIESHPGSLFLADVKGKVVGAVIAAFDGWRGSIYRLAVDADYRRRGLARAMVHEAEARLAARGAKRISALVESDHPWATGFWDEAGYERDPGMLRYFRNLP